MGFLKNKFPILKKKGKRKWIFLMVFKPLHCRPITDLMNFRVQSFYKYARGLLTSFSVNINDPFMSKLAKNCNSKRKKLKTHNILIKDVFILKYSILISRFSHLVFFSENLGVRSGEHPD